MTVEPCQTWMNRPRTFRVAGFGAIALLTVSSGVGCGQAIMRTPVAKGATAPPPIPSREVVSANDPNPGPFGGWGRKTGAEAGNEVAVTPISPTPLEVAVGPKLILGTWNGWRMPMGKRAAKTGAPDVAETASNSPVVATTATSIPMPKRPTQTSGNATDDTKLAASRASKIALPLRHFSKPASIGTDSPKSAPDGSAFDQTGIAPPLRSAKPAAIAEAAPVVLAAPLAVEAPMVAANPFKETGIAAPSRRQTQAATPAAAVEPAPEPVVEIDAADEKDVMTSPASTSPEVKDTAVEEVDPKPESAPSEVADPAPSFEPKADVEASPKTREPSTPESADATEVTPDFSPTPTAPQASNSTAPEASSGLPEVVLPEFDKNPLNIVEGSKLAEPTEEPVAKIDEATAQATNPDNILKKAAAASKIPLPSKKGVRPSKAKAKLPPAVTPVVTADDAPAELDPTTYQATTIPPPIPSRIQE